MTDLSQGDSSISRGNPGTSRGNPGTSYGNPGTSYGNPGTSYGNPGTSRWDVVVLGGGDPGDAFAAAHGVAVKTLVPIAGQPMALYVLQALRACPATGRIAYVGPIPAGGETMVDLRVTDHGTLIGNLEVGVEALRLPEHQGKASPQAGHQASHTEPGRPERVMVITADIPMLTAQMLSDVLGAAPDAGLVYPIVRREDCELMYPGVKRTYAPLKDGTFTGGNLFLLDASLVGQFLPKLREILDARKQPLKLAALIGPMFLLRLLIGQLSIEQLQDRVSQILGVQARALITAHAAIGTDVDKEGDLELAENALSKSFQ